MAHQYWADLNDWMKKDKKDNSETVATTSTGSFDAVYDDLEKEYTKLQETYIANKCVTHNDTIQIRDNQYWFDHINDQWAFNTVFHPQPQEYLVVTEEDTTEKISKHIVTLPIENVGIDKLVNWFNDCGIEYVHLGFTVSSESTNDLLYKIGLFDDEALALFNLQWV